MITEIYCVSGTSGDDHVFISSGVDVSLSCNKHLSDCKSTSWTYSNSFGHSWVELITGGIKNKDTERHERLSLESDCSLNIKNVTGEDYGVYRCRQYVNYRQQVHNAGVFLHVLHVSVSPSSSSSSSSSQTEISPGRSVTLSCQLYLYSVYSCDVWSGLSVSDSELDLFFSHRDFCRCSRCSPSCSSLADLQKQLVKDEDEHKGTYETINMSIPPDLRADEQTDDVTYSEVSSFNTKPVKSLDDHDTVTYAAIRGREDKPQDQLYKNKTFTNTH
ncbi:diverse immunoglobulin domain-containing protein 3.3 [Pimephales promelas]|nr:diverse immunoglobulin domain-containing protein 3.3 [Pimephales promelas]